MGKTRQRKKANLKKTATLEKRQDVDSLEDRRIAAMKFPGALPFKTHISAVELPNSHLRDGSEIASLWWSAAEARVADATLSAGFVISLRVHPDDLAQAIFTVTQVLQNTVYGRYERIGHRLIIWSVEDKISPDADPERLIRKVVIPQKQIEAAE